MMKWLYHTRVARAIAVVASIYTLLYLWWRATATLNPDALVFSLIFLAAEVQGALNFFLFAFMTWDVQRRPPFRLQEGLSVDIYVPTYNEDLEVLEPTLIGCRSITYPHVTYVLDDGRRPEVQALAERLGCRYLTRPNNRHAKAGNLNAALPRTNGDFIVILDADMVPQPDFLDRTLGYFVDERVALVQLPQEFYNLDSVQHRPGRRDGGPWHDQTLFFRVIQPGKNRWNAAFWCGSPSVLRRAALEDIGGVATGTVTEDIHTSVRLHARGWKTVYHNEALAFGIAPATLHAFAVQRLRWAQGTMQLLRTADNPLLKPGLTLAQRLNYLASMGTYFDCYQKLTFLLAPPIILSTGMLPLRVEGMEFLLHWIPYFLLGTLANVALGRGHFRYIDVELLNLLKVFIFLRAQFTLIWPKPLPFKVTPKRTDQSVKLLDMMHLRSYLGLLALTRGGVALGLANLVWGITAIYANEDIVWITIFWALVNAWILALGVRNVYRRVYRRRSYRFPLRVPAMLALGGASSVATVEDLSAYGARVVSNLEVGPRSRVTLSLSLADGPLDLAGEVVHCAPLGNGRVRAGLKLEEMVSTDRERLLELLFVTLARRQVQEPRPGPAFDREAALTLPPGLPFYS